MNLKSVKNIFLNIPLSAIWKAERMVMFLSYVTSKVFPIKFTKDEVHKGALDLKILQVIDFKTGRYSEG
jgi:hypothetical protein